MKVTIEELEAYLFDNYRNDGIDQSLFMKLVEEIGEVAEVLNKKKAGRKSFGNEDLQVQLGNELADVIHYALAIAALNGLDMSVGCSYYEDLQKTGITYFIGAQYRDNGYAVEAVKAYTDYFFNHYNAKRMIATVRDENIPSWKVIEKVGFILSEKRMYKDLNDDEEKLYCFYENTK